MIKDMTLFFKLLRVWKNEKHKLHKLLIMYIFVKSIALN